MAFRKMYTREFCGQVRAAFLYYGEYVSLSTCEKGIRSIVSFVRYFFQEVPFDINLSCSLHDVLQYLFETKKILS